MLEGIEEGFRERFNETSSSGVLHGVWKAFMEIRVANWNKHEGAESLVYMSCDTKDNRIKPLQDSGTEVRAWRRAQRCLAHSSLARHIARQNYRSQCIGGREHGEGKVERRTRRWRSLDCDQAAATDEACADKDEGANDWGDLGVFVGGGSHDQDFGREQQRERNGALFSGSVPLSLTFVSYFLSLTIVFLLCTNCILFRYLSPTEVCGRTLRCVQLMLL